MSEKLPELPPGNNMEAGRSAYLDDTAALETLAKERQQILEAYEKKRAAHEEVWAEYLGRLHDFYVGKQIRVRGPATIIVPGRGAGIPPEERTSDQVKHKHVDKVVTPHGVGIHSYHPELAGGHEDSGSEEGPTDSQAGQPILRATDGAGRSYDIKTDDVHIRFLEE